MRVGRKIVARSLSELSEIAMFLRAKAFVRVDRRGQLFDFWFAYNAGMPAEACLIFHPFGNSRDTKEGAAWLAH